MVYVKRPQTESILLPMHTIKRIANFSRFSSTFSLNPFQQTGLCPLSINGKNFNFLNVVKRQKIHLIQATGRLRPYKEYPTKK